MRLVALLAFFVLRSALAGKRSALSQILTVPPQPILIIDPPPVGPTLSHSGSPIFNAMDHLSRIIAAVHSFDASGCPRELDCVDFFSGMGAITNQFLKAGRRAAAYDVLTDRVRHDLTSETGFWHALGLVCGLRVHGLLCAGPPCSLWVFMSTSQHCREPDCAWGDTEDPSIRAANILVCNLVILLALAVARDVFTLLEQPLSSKMLRFEPMRRWIQWSKATVQHTYLRAFGHWLPKPTRLWGTLPDIHKFGREWSPRIEKKMILQSILVAAESPFTRRWLKKRGLVVNTSQSKLMRKIEKMKKSKSAISGSGLAHNDNGKWVTGSPALAQSAAYPEGFGLAILKMWLCTVSSAPASAAESTDYEKIFSEMGWSAGFCKLASMINTGAVTVDDSMMPLISKKRARKARPAPKKKATKPKDDPKQRKLNFQGAAK